MSGSVGLRLAIGFHLAVEAHAVMVAMTGRKNATIVC
jgi:hypothetical protein